MFYGVTQTHTRTRTMTTQERSLLHTHTDIVALANTLPHIQTCMRVKRALKIIPYFSATRKQMEIGNRAKNYKLKIKTSRTSLKRERGRENDIFFLIVVTLCRMQANKQKQKKTNTYKQSLWVRMCMYV